MAYEPIDNTILRLLDGESLRVNLSVKELGAVSRAFAYAQHYDFHGLPVIVFEVNQPFDSEYIEARIYAPKEVRSQFRAAWDGRHLIAIKK